ncbi:hypothetical protein Trco_004057 [Trichoderma cornu-damae]|uniref:Uncharacterized protein n=1 Tax=Trichoderma cornu-damae TaxID=654480 RepID=A0A9P8TWK0_9HYPO|nr:hypothetical protein Trco_004057 [Trichoderma cornu-damae]
MSNMSEPNTSAAKRSAAGTKRSMRKSLTSRRENRAWSVSAAPSSQTLGTTASASSSARNLSQSPLGTASSFSFSTPSFLASWKAASLAPGLDERSAPATRSSRITSIIDLSILYGDAWARSMARVMRSFWSRPSAVLLKALVAPQHRLEDVQKVLQRKLVEVVDVVQLLQDGEDGAARLGDDAVLLRDLLHLGHDALRVAHLVRDVRRLRLQRLQRLDDLVVVQDVAAGLVEGLQQLLLQLPQMDLELALQLDEVRAPLVHVGALRLEHVVERLGLEAALGDREVDKGGAAADVRRERGRRVSGGEVELERRREVNVLLAELDEDAPAGSLVLLVQDVVEDGVQVLGVLDEDGVAESQRALELLREGVVQEAGDGQAAVLALLLQELRDPSGRVDDERVAVEALEDDGVLRAQVVDRQRVLLPPEPLVRAGQVLRHRVGGLELDAGQVQLVVPVVHHVLPERLVVEAAVGQERRGDEDVPDEGADLGLERLAPFLPAGPLGRQAVEEPDAPVDLELDLGHLRLDGLGLADEGGVLGLVGVDAGLELGDVLLHGHRVGLRLERLLLQLRHFLPERPHAVQDVRVADLGDDPLDEGAAGLGGVVHLLKRKLGVGQELVAHLVPQAPGHHLRVVKHDDAGDEVFLPNHRLDRLPIVDPVPEQGADGIQREPDALGGVGHASHLDQVLPLDVADARLGLLDRRLRLCQVLQHDLLPHRHLRLLPLQRGLYLQRGVLPLLRLPLVRHHPLQLLVRLRVLLLELRLLLGEAGAQIAHLVHGVPQLLEADVQVALLLLQILPLFVVQPDVLGDEVQEVARGQERDLALLLQQLPVVPLQRVVDVHHRVDDRLAVRRRQLQAAVGHRDRVGGAEAALVQVDGVRELVADLEQRLPAFGRVHGEDDVQVVDDLLGEPLVQLLRRVEVQVLPLGAFLAGRHEGDVVVALEEARHLGVGEQRVHALQETGVQDVGLVHDEADLLALAAASPQHVAQVFVEVLRRVLAVDLDLEHLEAVHPGHEPREGSLAAAAHADEDQVALRLPEDAVDAQHVLQDVVEQDERNVDLFLAERLEASGHEVPQLLPVDGDVVLGEPVGEQNGAAESLLFVHGGEEFQGDAADGLVGPLALLLVHETILEEPQGLVRPDADEALQRQRLQGLDRFVHAADPAEADHGVGERLRVAAERGDDLEHGRVEGAVNLVEGKLPGVIDHDEGGVAEEPSAHGRAAGVGGRIAGPDELDAVEGDPRLVGGPPEAVVLDELAQEGDGALGAVLVGGREVDLVAEDDQPAADLRGRQHHAFERLLVLAVLLERLDQEVGRRRAGEVEADDLHVRQLAESAEERHRLTGAGGAAEQQRLVLGEPGVEDVLVAHGIEGRDDDVGLDDGVRVDLDAGHLVLPRRPLGLRQQHVEVDERAGAVQGRRAEVGKGADVVAKGLPVAERTVSRERPDEREQQLLRHEALDLIVLQGEIGVLPVVFDDVSGGLVQQREEGGEDARDRKLHDVAVPPSALQRLVDEVFLGQVPGEQVGDLGLDGQRLGRALARGDAVLVQVLEGDAAEGLDVVGNHHVGRNGVLAEPNHATSTDGGERRILQRLDLEHDSDVGRQVEALSVGQGEQLVVVEDAVQVLDPLGVDVAVEDDPVSLGVLAAEVVDDLAEDAGEEAVGPLSRGGVQVAVERLLGHDLGVDDVGDALDALDLLQGVEQEPPGGGLPGAGIANHHDAVVDLLDLVQLEDLGHPQVGDHEMALGGERADGFLESDEVGGHVLDAGEAVLLDVDHDVHVRLDQLGRDRLADALHEDLGLDNLLGAEVAVAQASALEATGADQDALERAEAEVVVGLLRQVPRALVEEGHRLLGEPLGLAETLRVEHDFGDELLVGLGHGDAPEELLQVVGQVGAAGVAGVHGDEDARVLVDAELPADQLDLRLVVLGPLLQAELDVLDLLRNGRQDPLLETVKLVEAAPRTDLADAQEDAAHGLEVKGVVAAEDEREPPELDAQGLDGLGLPRAGGAVRRASEALAEGLGEREETPVGEGSPDEAIGDAEVLEAVVELGVGHLDVQAVEEVALRRVHVAHLKLPEVVARGVGLGVDQLLDHVPLVDALGDHLLALLALYDFEIPQDGLGEHAKDLHLPLEQGRQRLAAGGERRVDGGRPGGLGGEDDDLAGERVHEGDEGFAVDLVGLEDGGVVLHGLGEQLRERLLHPVLQQGEPVVDPGRLGQGDLLVQRDGLALLGGEARDDSLVIHDEAGQAGKHLLEMLGNAQGIVAVANHLQEILVADEVEPGEGHALLLEVFAEGLLDLVEHFRQALQGLLGIGDVEHVEDVGRLVGLLHDGQELAVDVLEAAGLDGEEVLDVGVPGEDALQVNPLALHVDPDVEEDVDAIQLVLPGHGVLLEFLVVGRVLHGLERVQVLAALGEEVVPATDKPALVLVVDHLEGVVLPRLADLLEELFESHLALGLGDDVLDDDLGGGEVEVPDIAEGHGAGRKALLGLDLLVNLVPVPLANGIGFQVGQDVVDLEEPPQNALDVLKSGVLPHPARHVLRALDQVVDLLANLPRLDGRPQHVPRLVEAGPDGGEIGPDGPEIADLLQGGLEDAVVVAGDVEGLSRLHDLLELLLQGGDASLERGQGGGGDVGLDGPGNGLLLVPLGHDLPDALVDQLVLGDDVGPHGVGLLLHNLGLLLQDLLEGLPLALDLLDVKPVVGERVALPHQGRLALAEHVDLGRPQLRIAPAALHRRDELDGGRGGRGVRALAFEVLARLLDVGVDVAHPVAQPVGKLDENLLLPLVVFGIHLGLDLVVVDGDVAKRAADLLRVEGRADLADVLEALEPPGEMVAEHVVDLIRLEVPEGLELEPLVHVDAHLSQLPLDGQVDAVEHLGAVRRQVGEAGFLLGLGAEAHLVSRSLDLAQVADDAQPVVQVKEPARPGVLERGVEVDDLVAHGDLEHEPLHGRPVLPRVVLLGRLPPVVLRDVFLEGAYPGLDRGGQALQQDGLNLVVDAAHPEVEVGILLQVELVDGGLDRVEVGLESRGIVGAGAEIVQGLLDGGVDGAEGGGL